MRSVVASVWFLVVAVAMSGSLTCVAYCLQISKDLS
jgi:hypothetical protein